MATAILDLEFEKLPARITGLDRYDEALILLRFGGQPVGKTRVVVRNGTITASELSKSLLHTVNWAFWDKWLRNYLNLLPSQTAQPRSATVAVCTRDRPDDLIKCLDSLALLPDDGQEIIVIDNHPATNATQQLVKNYPHVRYIREDRAGLDVARNRALHEARHEIVAFVDDDAVVDAHWLRALIANFDDPLALCVTGLTMPIELETDAQEWFERYSSFSRGFWRTTFDRIRLNPLEAGRVGAGVNMALRRSTLELVGPFDEALDAGTPTQSGGDTEMFSRILALGYRIIYDPSALSWHRHRRTWDELLRAVYGYGVGAYALWTRKLLFEREFGVIKLAWQWFWLYQLPSLIRSYRRKPNSIPRAILLAELRGCFRGPRAYLTSRKRLNQHQEQYRYGARVEY